MSLNMTLIAAGGAGISTQSMTAWVEQEEQRGREVERRRRYHAGDHDDNHTTAQKNLLNQAHRTAEDSHPLNDNLCGIVPDTMLDRITYLGVKSDSDAGDTWISDLHERNRIDGLQDDVHQAALVDGNTYLMVSPDPLTGKAVYTHEPAYDGAYGTVLRYSANTDKTPIFAVKTWRITTTETADATRINIYLPNRIVRWVGQTTTGLRPYTDDGQPAVIPWVDRTGQPLGVPFVHFKNRSVTGDNFGVSELDNIIGLQDLLNIVLSSIGATALLSGFPIRLLIGGEAPAAVVPGLVLSFAPPKDASGNLVINNEQMIAWLGAIHTDQFEVAELQPLLETAAMLKGEIYAVTNTPTDDVAADASGEARKQSEVKLIGKVKRFCVKNGNAWEDAVRLAARYEAAFTSSAPPITEETVLTAQWADPEVRNDSKFVADMLMQYEKGVIDQQTYLESVQDIFGWDDVKIKQIIQRTEQAKATEQQVNQEDAQAAAEAMTLARAGVNGNGNGATSKQPV